MGRHGRNVPNLGTRVSTSHEIVFARCIAGGLRKARDGSSRDSHDEGTVG